MSNVGDYMAYVWISIAVIMAIYEMATVQLVTVWFVVGATCAAISTIFVDDITIQFVIFVAVSLVTLIATSPIVKKFRKSTVKVSTNADRLVGEVGTMKADLTDSDEVGQAKVLGGVWSVKTDNPPLKKGDKVKVLSIDGVKLIVEKAE